MVGLLTAQTVLMASQQQWQLLAWGCQGRPRCLASSPLPMLPTHQDSCKHWWQVISCSGPMQALQSETFVAMQEASFRHACAQPCFCLFCFLDMWIECHRGVIAVFGLAGSPQTGTPSTPTGRLAVATPAVQLTSTPGASAEAAATAAAPSRDLVPVFDFGSFCFNKMLSDVELVAGGRSFPAHR